MLIISIDFKERSEGADEIYIWIPQTTVAIGSTIFFICVLHNFILLILNIEEINSMTELFLTIFFISILLIFLGSGVWVALSMIGVSAIGMLIFTTRPVGDAMATTIWGTSSSWTLTALPLICLDG